MPDPRRLALLLLLLLLLRGHEARRPQGLDSGGKAHTVKPAMLRLDALANRTGPAEKGAPRDTSPESLGQSSTEGDSSDLPNKPTLAERDVPPGQTPPPSSIHARPIPPSKSKLHGPRNTGKKHQRPKMTTAMAHRTVALPSLPNPRPPTSVENLHPLEEGGEAVATVAHEEQALWGSNKGSRGVTSNSPLQIVPFTALPATAMQPWMDDGSTIEHGRTRVSLQAKGTEREGKRLSAEESQETTTSTIRTTTVITPKQPTIPCGVNFDKPEGYIDSIDYLPMPRNNFLECVYNVTVYTGYGVELQVKSVNLSDGEVLAIRGVDHGRLVTLANQTLLVEGQVIRSPTNTISVYFRTFQDDVVGTFQLHYQVFMLSCSFPRKPDFGEVAVMGLHSGSMAHFHCHLGYELEGPQTLTCINASKPYWGAQEPTCTVPCGGMVHNATIGRILAPTQLRNHTERLVCVWTISAPEGQKLHLHFERLSLRDKQRLIVYSGGDTNDSAVLYDSQQSDSVPFEGVISEGGTLRVDFLGDDPNTGAMVNIRFEAFQKGHCYAPDIQNGNFTTSDPSYNVGTIVEFACDPGHSLEEGPTIIECINIRDPYWNDTEPLCRAMCGGDLSTATGLILSPNWPEPYGEGEDCIWRVHVGDEKRIFLNIQFLNLSHSDIFILYDGDDLSSHVLFQYLGGPGPRKLYSSTPDLTVKFHSDPAGLVFGKGHGFIMNYIEVSRNDSCLDLPEIQNGWKTTSHTELVREAKITYQCDPGYDIIGSDTLTCQWDLTWSSDPPFCEKIMYCTDPGEVDHSTRLISDPVLLVGTTIQYTCHPGFVLEGSSLLTCYSRETGTPIWTSRLPGCVSEETLACDNPGLPENGYQILYKRLYLPGESLTFMCYEGFELLGEVTIKCILGQPSHWSGPLPICKVNQDTFEHALEVAEAAAETSLDGGNMALAIFIPVLVVSLLLGGAYVYITRCRYYSSLRLPLMYSHPYSQITVETEFDNPIYETGETREYEVSI